MQSGKILYTICDKTCIIRMIGKIVYKISPGFDKFLHEIDSTVNIFIVDLIEAEYLDSTNLGLLAKLLSISNQRSEMPPILISPHKNINEIFKNVGFFNLFTIVDSWENSYSNFKELPQNSYTKANLCEVMLQAHQDLSQLNEENKVQFENVISFLNKEIKGIKTSAF